MVKIVDGKLKKNYRLLGATAHTIKWGIPIAYVVFRYGLFKFRVNELSITGGGILVIIMLFIAFRQKIIDRIKEWDDNLGEMSKHIKMITVWGTIFGIMFLVQVAVWAVVWLTFFFMVGNLGSLPIYSVYYKRKNEYLKVKKEFKRQQDEKIAKTLDKV